ncbi:MAG: sporulation integral membrane protein YtvI [Peptococcaceae bacterium]|jgi:sporulation integral membrane protein YtvI|nr:sporulation integral membrane protein YtvI [Peptococcaceae bacterium]
MSRFLWVVLHILAAALLVALGVVVLKYLFPVLVPFLIAVFLTVLIDPLVRFFQVRLHFSRGLAVLVSMAGVFLVLGLIVTVIIVRLVAELTVLSAALPATLKVVQNNVLSLANQALVFYGRLDPTVASYLQQAFGTFSKSLSAMVGAVIASLLYLTSAVPTVVIVLVVSLLATFFLSRDRQVIGAFLFGLFPSPLGDQARRVFQEAAGAGLAYLKAQLILVGITTILSILGLYLIGAKYALSVGLLVGFFDLVPLGPAALYLPWTAWAFFTGAVVLGIKLALLYGVIFIVRQLFESRIVAANLGLHPLAVLVAMYAGLKIMGFFGILLGLLTVIIAKALTRSGMSFTYPRK